MDKDKSKPDKPNPSDNRSVNNNIATNELLVPNKITIAEGMQRVGKHGKSHHEYLKIMNQHEASDKSRPISLEELSGHKTKESAWLSLNGVVYDVTVYLDYHPGGNILLQGCVLIDLRLDSYHPWVNGKYLLSKYQIGYLL